MRGTKAKLLRKKAKAAGLVAVGYIPRETKQKPHLSFDANGKEQKSVVSVTMPIHLGTCTRGLYRLSKRKFGKGVSL